MKVTKKGEGVVPYAAVRGWISHGGQLIHFFYQEDSLGGKERNLGNYLCYAYYINVAKDGKVTEFVIFVHEATCVEHGNTQLRFCALSVGLGIRIMNGSRRT